MQVRRATMSDLQAINQFIRESKAFWGYSEPFLDLFMEKWGVKASFLEQEEIIIFEQNNALIGLYAFKMNERTLPELDLFFINANKIRQGIGAAIWQHALKYALSKGWDHFELISDPNAEGFYLKMGAKKLRTFESFPGRFVPVMRVDVAYSSS